MKIVNVHFCYFLIFRKCKIVNTSIQSMNNEKKINNCVIKSKKVQKGTLPCLVYVSYQNIYQRTYRLFLNDHW